MKNPTNSLDRALAMLERIERAPGGLRHAELSRAMGIPKSTCSYILTRMERCGYVTRDPETGRYKLGLTMVALAHGALREIGLRSIAEPPLYKLATATGLSAGMGVLERGRVLIIDRVEGSEFVREAVQSADAPAPAGRRPGQYRVREDRDIGRELPAHATALGKVLLAYLPQNMLARPDQQRLLRLTKRTIPSKARLLEELDQVCRQGYATADGEYSPGLRAIAAPIYGIAGVVSAGVSLNGQIPDAAWSDPGELIELVRAAAREISRRLRQRGAAVQ